MKRYLFLIWIVLSVGFGMFLCMNHLPIRDENFPALQDYTNSLIFLCGEALMLSALASVGGLIYKEKTERILLAVITAILLLALYVFMFKSLLTFYLLISEGVFVLMAVGAVHYVITALLKRFLIPGETLK